MANGGLRSFIKMVNNRFPPHLVGCIYLQLNDSHSLGFTGKTRSLSPPIVFALAQSFLRVCILWQKMKQRDLRAPCSTI